MKARKNFIGLEGFVWWIGVVEDRNDPEQLNRARVRCFGWHTENKEKIPTDTLPWAHPIVPINNPASYSPKEGEYVFGFFLDGDQAQNPVIVGVLPGKPEKKPDYNNGFSDPGKELGSRPKRPDDAQEAYPKSKYLNEVTTTRLARGKKEGTVIKTRVDNKTSNISSAGGVSWSEPDPAYEPKYPYNYAHETESGHAFELDDTPQKERIHLAHRLGTYFEINAEGSKAEKIIKDNYTLIMGSDYVYVSGKCSVTVDGDCNLRVGGNMNIEVAGQINMAAGGDIRMKGKQVFFESTDNMSIKSAGTTALESSGALSFKSASTAVMEGAGKASVKGSSVALSGSSVDVTGTLNAGSTNMKATGTDTGTNGGSSHNLSVAGSGGSAADSAAPATATGLSGGGSAPETTDKETAQETRSETSREGQNGAAGSIDKSLESTQQTSNTATPFKTAAGQVANTITETVGSVTGKTLSGQSLSSTKVFEKLDQQLSKVTDLVNKIPGELATLPQLAGEFTKAQNLINSVRGEILNLSGFESKEILGAIDNVINAANEKGITFDIDTDITNAILKDKNAGAVLGTQLGKRLYPKTELISNAISNTISTIVGN